MSNFPPSISTGSPHSKPHSKAFLGRDCWKPSWKKSFIPSKRKLESFQGEVQLQRWKCKEEFVDPKSRPFRQTTDYIYIYIIFRGERSWVSYLCFFLKIITQDSQCKSPGHLGRSVPMVRQCHSLDCTAFGWPSSQGMMWPQARARRFETPGCKGSAPRAWPLLIQTPALPENYVG